MSAEPTTIVSTEAEGRPAADDSSYEPHKESLSAGSTLNWQVWVRWVVYTMIGYSLASGLGVLVGTYVPGGAILGPLVGIPGMALVGLAQWLVLRRYIRGMKWPGWIIATAAGQLLGGIVSVVIVLGPVVFGVLGELPDIIGVTPTQFLIGFLSGLVLGIVLGFLQWLVLSRYVHNAGTAWWIVGSALAQGVAAGVSSIVHIDSGLGGPVTLMISRLLFSAIVGAISGVALIFILQTWYKRQAASSPVQVQVQPG